METFVDWLENELNKRNWSRADLSRHADISQSAISHIYAGSRKPGKDVCSKIARALKLPEETVFRAAGILQPTYDQEDWSPTLLEWVKLFKDASDEEREIMLENARFFSNRSNKDRKKVADTPK